MFYLPQRQNCRKDQVPIGRKTGHHSFKTLLTIISELGLKMLEREQAFMSVIFIFIDHI